MKEQYICINNYFAFEFYVAISLHLYILIHVTLMTLFIIAQFVLRDVWTITYETMFLQF